MQHKLLQAWQEKAAGRKIVLHVGCAASGREKLYPRYQSEAEWCEIRVDIDEAAKPDLLADMRTMPMVPAGAADAIWTSHTIEHVNAHEVQPMLREWFRVIKMGGELGLTLPDAQAVACHVAHGKLEEELYKAPGGLSISALDVLYGYGADIARGKHYMAHRTAFTAESLARHLMNAGFCNVTVMRKQLNLWAACFKRDMTNVNHQKKTRIVNEGEPLQPPGLPPTKQPHPGAMPGKLPDELDVPPLLLT
jgi:hypothetical protein